MQRSVLRSWHQVVSWFSEQPVMVRACHLGKQTNYLKPLTSTFAPLVGLEPGGMTPPDGSGQGLGVVVVVVLAADARVPVGGSAVVLDRGQLQVGRRSLRNVLGTQIGQAGSRP